MHSNRYTIVFALLVCVTCSVILALTAGGLKPLIQKNEQFDIHRNILKALDLWGKGSSITVAELEKLYVDRIREFEMDQSGKLTPVVPRESMVKGVGTTALPVFVRIDNGVVNGYCIPVSGKGLWSTIYGYLAIDADGETIKGITFYKHGETPGLGGEVESEWFTQNFIGKKIFDETGKLTSITVSKGPVSADVPEKRRHHMVDGISGASMTGKGVTIFLKRDLEHYEPLFQLIRRGETPMVQGA